MHCGVRHWKTEVVANGLEMLSGGGKKEYAKEAQVVAEADGNGVPPTWLWLVFLTPPMTPKDVQSRSPGWARVLIGAVTDPLDGPWWSSVDTAPHSS